MSRVQQELVEKIRSSEKYDCYLGAYGDFINNLQFTPTNTHTKFIQSYVHPDLKHSYRVYIRSDHVKRALEHLYVGPFPVLERCFLFRYFPLWGTGPRLP
ncbi:unnamed protein product [Clavelina lepadiformis]|uniref:Uncharacterized protein n=1 Tax=Clavelina lepadiformis TaxID=159417 RepID=A0ABP0GWM8_CLALP